MDTQTTIRVPGMTRLDRLEIGHELGADAVRFEEEALPDGQHGELATTAIVVVTVLSLKVLASWLIKNRTSNKIRKTIEIVGADGSRRSETIEIDMRTSTTPERDIMGQLAKLCEIDLSSFSL